MSRSVSALLAEFDEVVEKQAALAQTKTASPAEEADAVVKLAERLARSESVKTASVGVQTDPASLLTQIARSLAITDTLLNLPTLAKVAELEKKAVAAGATPEQVGAYIEKHAAALPMVSVMQYMPWLF